MPSVYEILEERYAYTKEEVQRLIDKELLCVCGELCRNGDEQFHEDVSVELRREQ